VRVFATNTFDATAAMAQRADFRRRAWATPRGDGATIEIADGGHADDHRSYGRSVTQK